MESVGLTEFLKTVGRAVHSVNTICVGLNGVETGAYEKHDDLTITWDPKDPVASSRSARQFAIESSLVFVEEALLQYLKYVAKHPCSTSTVKSAIARESASDRIEELTKVIAPKESYWTPIVLLLIHWRNRIVHTSSKAKLKSHQEKLLTDNLETIRSRHANIDIAETLNHFLKNKITLKDASTLIAITIRFVRETDELLQLDSNTQENIYYWIKYLDIVDEYNVQLHSNGTDTKRRKFLQFFKTHLPFVTEDVILQLIENPLVFAVKK
jgi:hypothetical protein